MDYKEDIGGRAAENLALEGNGGDVSPLLGMDLRRGNGGDVSPLAGGCDALGEHYRSTVDPIDYCYANGLGFCQGNIVKYITRYKKKNGMADVVKALNYCLKILKYEYGLDLVDVIDILEGRR